MSDITTVLLPVFLAVFPQFNYSVALCFLYLFCCLFNIPLTLQEGSSDMGEANSAYWSKWPSPHKGEQDMVSQFSDQMEEKCDRLL